MLSYAEQGLSLLRTGRLMASAVDLHDIHVTNQLAHGSAIGLHTVRRCRC